MAMYGTKSWKRCEELYDYIFNKLIEKGYKKETAVRAANSVIRNNYEYLADLQNDMNKKNWYKDKVNIGKHTADILEREFKNDSGPIKRLNRAEMDEIAKEISEWWNELLPMMLVEECAELQKAVIKLERFERCDDTDSYEDRLKKEQLKDDIITEMADVIISIEAYRHWQDMDLELITRALNDKLQKRYTKRS